MIKLHLLLEFKQYKNTAIGIIIASNKGAKTHALKAFPTIYLVVFWVFFDWHSMAVV